MFPEQEEGEEEEVGPASQSSAHINECLVDTYLHMPGSPEKEKFNGLNRTRWRLKKLIHPHEPVLIPAQLYVGLTNLRARLLYGPPRCPYCQPNEAAAAIAANDGYLASWDIIYSTFCLKLCDRQLHRIQQWPSTWVDQNKAGIGIF